MQFNEVEERVVLVNEDDEIIGESEKLDAHRKGLLHRAFSIFVFNADGELLLQRRALQKYHSAGKWSNTCCSHPRPGESLESAVERRLMEEMGLTCDLKKEFSFVYRSKLDDGLIEHEHDHVFVGHTDVEPNPDDSEVAEWRYASLASIREELYQDPDRFTSWFRISYEQVFQSCRDAVESENLNVLW